MSRGKDGSGVVTASRAPDGFEPDHTPLAAQGTEQRGAGVKEAQNVRRQDSRQLGKEQNVLEEASNLSEYSSPIGAANDHEEPRGKATRWHSLAQERAKPARARPAPPELRVKDCRQTAERLSAGPSAAKPDGVAVTPKRKEKTTKILMQRTPNKKSDSNFSRKQQKLE